MKTFVQILISSFLIIAASSRTIAATSEWQDLGGGKARLAALKDPDTNRIFGIIEVVLNDGWKTYWRSPGGSGIAPEFDFSQSEHAVIDEISFPVPQWIDLKDAQFFGYKSRVSFAFEGEALSPDAAIKLDMLIGICEEICIPSTAQFVLTADTLNVSDPKADFAIDLAKGALPQKADADLMVSQLVFSDGKLNATISDSKPDVETLIVAELPNMWISDPVLAIISGEARKAATILIPDYIAIQLAQNSLQNPPQKQQWRYSLIQRSSSDRQVIRAVDGISMVEMR